MSIIFTPTSSDVIITSPLVSPTSSIIVSDPFSPTTSLLVTDYIITTPTLTPITTITGSIPPLTINLEYSKPLISVYETIDTDPEVRQTMVNYYFDLIRDDWFLDDLNDILNYFVYRDGKVSTIKNISEYNPVNIAKDTDKIAEEKVKYITKNVFTRYNLLDVLTQFIRGTNSKWVNLPKNEFFVKQAVKEYIVKEIRRLIKGKSD